jgi:molybdopterin converting factor small subunit
MSVTVELTYELSKALGDRRLQLDGAATVADAVRLTRERFAGKGEAESFDKLTRVASLAVNGVLINHARNQQTPLADGDRLTFLMAAAGG